VWRGIANQRATEGGTEKHHRSHAASPRMGPPCASCATMLRAWPATLVRFSVKLAAVARPARPAPDPCEVVFKPVANQSEFGRAELGVRSSGPPKGSSVPPAPPPLVALRGRFFKPSGSYLADARSVGCAYRLWLSQAACQDDERGQLPGRVSKRRLPMQAYARVIYPYFAHANS
jgi:hypothetical protein